MRFPKWGFVPPWAKTRWEVKRFHSQHGDRRATFYLRRDGRFEYSIEKLNAPAAGKGSWSENPWQPTYQSEPFDGLIAAKEDARHGFAWLQEH